MRKILFVDDEESILDIYKNLLEDTDYEVFTAPDGFKALEIIEKNVIPVMFLDLNMPGMSGLELCERIRESNSISIINAITGYSSLFELVEIRNAGFDDYFKKPIRMEKLLEVIEDCFEKIDRWEINFKD
ncbi:MAG: response regulator [Candidatus Marinimicrobia bacterium]|nr:response regulator [Candidatus Neomarinimicrobiota bacterium]